MGEFIGEKIRDIDDIFEEIRCLDENIEEFEQALLSRIIEKSKEIGLEINLIFDIKDISGAYYPIARVSCKRSVYFPATADSDLAADRYSEEMNFRKSIESSEKLASVLQKLIIRKGVRP